MTNEEAVRELHDGWDLLLSQAKIIAMLPIEEWLRAFDRAETMGPILDPTLYREYIYDKDRKGESLKELFRAALPLKQAVLKLQERYKEQSQ